MNEAKDAAMDAPEKVGVPVLEVGGRGSARARNGAQSLLRYGPALLLLLIVMTDSMQYADTDLWGHVRFGQIMLSTGQLLGHDIFSYSAPGAFWIHDAWLSQVIMGALYNAAGVVGLKLMKFLCTAVILCLMTLDLTEEGVAPMMQFATLLALMPALELQIQFRPQLFDYIFLSALLALFARARTQGNARMWLAIPIMCAWANFHGGYFVGLAVLGMYTVACGVQDACEGRGIRRFLWLCGLVLAATLVTLINPYGIRLWELVAYAMHNPFTMHDASEYQSFFHVLVNTYYGGGELFPFLLALGVMIALPVSFMWVPSLDDLPELAIATMMVCGALYSVRNMAFALIACAAPVAWRVESALRARARMRRSSDDDAELIRVEPGGVRHVPMSVQAVALVAAIIFSISGGLFSRRLPDFISFPVGAMRFMRKHGMQGRIFSRLIWGNYLIWHLVPPSKVFIDSFWFRYPEAVQRDYVAFLGGGAGAKRVLAAYPPDFVLMGTDSPQFRFMMRQEGWRLIYRDPVSALFARTGSSAARIAGVPVLRDKAPPSFFP